MRRLGFIGLIALFACTSPAAAPTAGADLPAIDGPGLEQLIADLDKPAVVNVWASWCLPCRAEAPLLKQAYDRFGDQVEFIGIDYNDTQTGARQFLAEFDLPFRHYFDRPGESFSDLGGFGVPRTYFFASSGELVTTHSGVIDEQTLALQIDELLSR